MYTDSLISYLIFQIVFLFLDAYIYSLTNRDIARKDEYTSFCALILIHMIYLLLNSIWSLQEYNMLELPYTSITIICTVSLLCVSGCAYVFFRFTCARIQFTPMQNKSISRLVIIPQLVVALMIISSPFTHIIFSIDAEGNMVHEAFYTYMLVISSIYLFAVIPIAGYNMFRSRSATKRLSSSALVSSVIIILVFILIDDMLMKTTILPAAIFAVIIVCFITMQEANINSDALTNMNNRRKADEHLVAEMNTVSETQPLYLFIGDIDHFKGINDNYGHLEGDDALILCAETLKHLTIRHGGFAARFGGDEFLVSIRTANHAGKPAFDPEAVIKEINDELKRKVEVYNKPYSLSMTVGYARCTDRSESIKTYFSVADEMLYSRKAGKR